MNLDPQCLYEKLNAICAFDNTKAVKIAYSGGADSTVLLYLLVRLRQQVKFRLTALHVNHGIHVQSDNWQDQCAKFCQSHDVEFRTIQLNLGNCENRVSEAKARTARYDWLKSQLETGDLLLTAHHRDDQVETVLLNWMRGAGPRGLSAMQSVQEFPPGILVRPLLDCSRSQIIEFTKTWGLSCIDDPANDDLTYDRNYLRHVVLPSLTQRWPEAHRQIEKSSEHLAKTRGLLDDLARLDMLASETQDGSFLSTVCPLSVNHLKTLGKARQINLIRYWTRENVKSEPGRRALDEFIHIAFALDKKFAELAWANRRIFRYQNALFLVRKPHSTESLAPIEWDLQAPLRLEQVGIQLVPTSVKGCGLDPNKLTERVNVSFRRGSERIVLPGRRHSSSLKKLFQLHFIPPWERGLLPLVYCKDTLAAVVPWLVADPFRVDNDKYGIVIELECI